jgi:hypothetical protein
MNSLFFIAPEGTYVDSQANTFNDVIGNKRVA